MFRIVACFSLALALAPTPLHHSPLSTLSSLSISPSLFLVPFLLLPLRVSALAFFTRGRTASCICSVSHRAPASPPASKRPELTSRHRLCLTSPHRTPLTARQSLECSAADLRSPLTGRMPYTPPTQSSPASPKPNRPTLTRSHSHSEPPPAAAAARVRPPLPRSLSATAYIHRHRRSPSIAGQPGLVLNTAAVGRSTLHSSANGSPALLLLPAR